MRRSSLRELKSGNAEADVILNEIVIWQPEDRFELEATEQNLVRLAEEHTIAIAALITMHGIRLVWNVEKVLI